MAKNEIGQQPIAINRLRPFQARANRWLAPMAAAVGLLLAAILGIPVLRDLMGLAPAGLAAWGAGAGVLVLSVVWLEGLRRIARRKENAR